MVNREMVDRIFSAFLNDTREEESNVTPYVAELMGLIENSVDQEQREQANEAVYSLSLNAEQEGFFEGFKYACDLFGLGDHAASYGQKNVGVGTVTTNNGAIGNFYAPVTIINGSKNQPAGNEAELLQSFAMLNTLDQAKVFVFIDELTAGKSE